MRSLAKPDRRKKMLARVAYLHHEKGPIRGRRLQSINSLSVKKEPAGLYPPTP